MAIAAIMWFSSCEEPVRTEMTKDERELLDSLYAKQVGAVRKHADSICDAMYQDLFDSAADSFYSVYEKEIKAIINGEG